MPKLQNEHDLSHYPDCPICYKPVVIGFRASCGDHHCHLKCLIRMYSNSIRINCRIALEGTSNTGRLDQIQISIDIHSIRCPKCRMGARLFRFDPGRGWLRMFNITPPSHDELSLLQRCGLLLQIDREKLRNGKSLFRCPMCKQNCREYALFLRHIKLCCNGRMWCPLCQSRIIENESSSRVFLQNIRKHVREECTGLTCPDSRCGTKGTASTVIKCYASHSMIPRIKRRINVINEWIHTGVFTEDHNQVQLTLLARYVDEVFNYMHTATNGNPNRIGGFVSAGLLPAGSADEEWYSHLFSLSSGAPITHEGDEDDGVISVAEDEVLDEAA